MDIRSIRKLIEIVEQSDIAEIEIKEVILCACAVVKPT